MKNLIFTFKKQLLVVALVCIGVPLMAEQVVITVNSRNTETVPADYSNLKDAFVAAGYDTPEELAAITDLKVNTEGKYSYNNKEYDIALDINDMTFINAQLTSLAYLDLSDATVTDNYGLGRGPNNNFPVKSFLNNTTIKSIKLPSTLINIGQNAFANTALEGVINIPKSVKDAASVDYNRFGNSQKITGFQADPESAAITTVDGVVFNKAMTEIHYYPSGKTDKDYTIPEGVTTIRNSAFEHNYHLKSLTLASTTTTTQAGASRFDVIANQSEIENVFVATGNTILGSVNGVLYQLEGNRVVWSPRGKVALKIPAPIQKIAGGGSQNSIFGGNSNNPITGNPIPNNYAFVITLLDLPLTLEEIENGAFVGTSYLAQIICRATTVPTIGQATFREVGGLIKTGTQVYVPASSLQQYTASAWAGNSSYNGFPAANFHAFHNLQLTDATAESSIASDISFENDIVAINAIIPAGKKFAKWATTTEGVIFTDVTSSTTTFTMPAKDVEITATFKDSEGFENIGDNLNAVFSGKWDETAFNTFAQANAAQLTTIDLTDVAELTQVPAIANLNPNGLIYVSTGVIGSEGQNIVTKDGDAYTSGNITLAETADGVKNNSFKNTHAFTGSVSYTRDFTGVAGKFASICLPFVPTNTNELSGLEFEEFDKITISGDKASLNFNTIEANALQANVPYILRIAPETTNVTFKGTSVPETIIENPSASEGYAFNGNMNYTTDATTYYLLSTDGSKFAKGATNSYITAFRAYLTAGNDTRKLSVTHNDDAGATGLHGQQTDNLSIYAANGTIYVDASQSQKVNIYSVDGRIIKTVELNIGQNSIAGIAKGIYLINKQKVVIK